MIWTRRRVSPTHSLLRDRNEKIRFSHMGTCAENLVARSIRHTVMEDPRAPSPLDVSVLNAIFSIEDGITKSFRSR